MNVDSEKLSIDSIAQHHRAPSDTSSGTFSGWYTTADQLNLTKKKYRELFTWRKIIIAAESVAESGFSSDAGASINQRPFCFAYQSIGSNNIRPDPRKYADFRFLRKNRCEFDVTACVQ